MEMKDYYSILQLPSSASVPDIKKTFRKLAMQYHPDKNNNDPYATARFAEIKEAYEVLTHPGRREIYLQQRWYNQSLGKKRTREMVTPVSLLKQVLELDRYVSTLDMHRMDKYGLHAYIENMLSDEMIEKLNAYNEPAINREIILVTLKCGALLPVSLMDELQMRLKKIHTDEATLQKINEDVRRKRQTARLTKYRPWILFAFVILLSLFIYFISRQNR